MNSSKIIRNLDELGWQNVALSNLDDITEAQRGSFVATDSASIVAAHPVVETVADESVDVAAAMLPSDPQALHDEYEKGRQAGINEVEQRLVAATESLAAACAEINGLQEKMLQRSSADMLRLVTTIAERVIQAELSIDPQIIVRTVQQAIQSAVSAEEFHIKINPADLEAVKEHKPLFIASLSGLSTIEFVADASVARGGCVLESAMGRVDATIEAQLEAIDSCLQQAIGQDNG